jgi:hypothetical protein
VKWFGRRPPEPRIPQKLRDFFEEQGPDAMHRLVYDGWSNPAGLTDEQNRIRQPSDEREHAIAWLKEQRTRQARKTWIGLIGPCLTLIVICIASYNLYLTKQADKAELIPADAKLFISQHALPHEVVTIDWFNVGKRAALRGTATLYTVSKDGSRFYKFGYSEITNGLNSSVTTLPPGVSTPYTQFPVEMQKYLGLFLVCTKYSDNNGHSYKQTFIFELGPHSGETTTQLDEVGPNIPSTTCKA